MFWKKQQTAGEGQSHKHQLLTINELTIQPDFLSALRLFPKFDLQFIPSNFRYQQSLYLKEKVEKSENGIFYRTDYIVIPKKGVEKLSGDRIAINPPVSWRFDDLLCFLNNHEGTREPAFGEVDIKRFLTSDGAEVYTYNGIEILEVKADICKECKECNETRRILQKDYNGNTSVYDIVTYGTKHKTIRDIREYKINPPLLGLLFGTGIHIAEISHPCQWRSLDEVLYPKYNTVSIPEIKIVFPKQEK